MQCDGHSGGLASICLPAGVAAVCVLLVCEYSAVACWSIHLGYSPTHGISVFYPSAKVKEESESNQYY
jgi:hypothetical protein